MDATIVTLVELMGSTTITFVSDVVTNLWPLFLSLGVLAFAGNFILRKTGMGRN